MIYIHLEGGLVQSVDGVANYAVLDWDGDTAIYWSEAQAYFTWLLDVDRGEDFADTVRRLRAVLERVEPDPV
jgi:broad specificity phosphatase PhoE